MPTTHKIAARTERRCTPCEFLKQSNMLCSRLHGITCDYLCKNPEAFDDTPLSEKQETRDKQIVMRARMAEHGRMIGNDDIQPNWCPLRRESAGTVAS